MQLQVLEQSESLIVVSLTGRLDIAGVQSVEMKFLGHTASRARSAIVDISGVSVLTSLGMGMLMSATRVLGRHGASLILLNPQPLVESALRAASLHEAIAIVHGIEEARSLLTRT